MIPAEKEEMDQTEFWHANLKSRILMEKSSNLLFGVPVTYQHIALHCLGNLCVCRPFVLKLYALSSGWVFWGAAAKTTQSLPRM